MKFLNGQDSFFNYSEAGNNYQHICSTLLLDPSTAIGEFSMETVKALFQARLHHLPSFRQRLLKVPYNMGPPAFVDDPDFNIDNHFEQMDLPAGSTLQDLAKLTSFVVSKPLDTEMPLWKVVFVAGLENGRCALIFQLHHCMIDGHGGNELAQNFYDLEPIDPAVIKLELEMLEKTKVDVAALPTQSELTLGSALSYYQNRPKFLDVISKKTRGTIKARQKAKKLGFEKQPFTRLFFNKSVSANRTVTFSNASLEDVKMIKNAFAVKVNDVILAATSLSLSEYLTLHNDLPDCPITACVAVDIHDQKEDDSKVMNHVGIMGVDLPVQMHKPADVINTVFINSQQAKKIFSEDYNNMLASMSDLLPSVTSVFMSQYAKLGLGAKLPQPYNLAISNNPGSPFPLYCAGAKIENIYPAGPAVEGQCLNVTIISYQDSIDICVTGCTEITPDIHFLSEGMVTAIAQLKDAAQTLIAEQKVIEKTKIELFGEASHAIKKPLKKKPVSGKSKANADADAVKA
ncbi:MAG: wax ester/triacylglycerol synthase family O-acyltransferase [Pseudomonadales bacterium]|nr:wax ester/triacylglycerol synthase family O-acyltransferase [Pseudomonadales bacterium]